MISAHVAKLHGEVVPGLEAHLDETREDANEMSPELRMANGKIMVIVGFIIAVFGIALYSVACFATNPDVGEIFSVGMPPWLGLMILGVGTVLWLVGNIIHFHAVMDAGPDGDTRKASPN